MLSPSWYLRCGSTNCSWNMVKQGNFLIFSFFSSLLKMESTGIQHLACQIPRYRCCTLFVNCAVRRTCNFKSKIRFLALVPPLLTWPACSWAAGIDQTTRASAFDPAARIREEKKRYFQSVKIDVHSLNWKLETTYWSWAGCSAETEDDLLFNPNFEFSGGDSNHIHGIPFWPVNILTNLCLWDLFEVIQILAEEMPMLMLFFAVDERTTSVF